MKNNTKKKKLIIITTLIILGILGIFASIIIAGTIGYINGYVGPTETRAIKTTEKFIKTLESDRAVRKKGGLTVSNKANYLTALLAEDTKGNETFQVSMVLYGEDEKGNETTEVKEDIFYNYDDNFCYYTMDVQEKDWCFIYEDEITQYSTFTNKENQLETLNNVLKAMKSENVVIEETKTDYKITDILIDNSSILDTFDYRDRKRLLTSITIAKDLSEIVIKYDDTNHLKFAFPDVQDLNLQFPIHEKTFAEYIEEYPEINDL